MENERNYAAFISYRHRPLDIALAESLHKMLERYVIPEEFRKDPEQKHLGIVFRDRDELPLSNDLTEDIYTALDHSEYLIVICTNETPKSEWVKREIEYFVSKHGHDRVLTVLAQDPPELSFPEGVTTVKDAAGNVIEQIEPLAAYVVGKNRFHSLLKLRSEFIRLVSAILGIPYGQLVQRQKRYRQRQLMIGMAVVLAVAAGFIGMLLNRNAQIQARNEQITAQNQEIIDKNKEIEAKNEEIRLQLEQSQRNESEALALLSAQQLADGDRRGAIESALNALPSDGKDRPYLALAESALVNALYAYQDPSMHYVSHIEQYSDIFRIAHSADGKYLITLDSHCTMRCYSAVTEELLWSAQVLEGTRYLDPYSEYISLYVLDKQQAVCAMGEVYALADGTYLYRLNKDDYDKDFDVEVFSPDRSIRAIPMRSSEGESLSSLVYTHFMVFQDTATGEIIAQSQPLPLPGIFHTTPKGSFSSDGSRYVAGFWNDMATKYEENSTTAILCLDTATGELLWQYGISKAQDPRCVMWEDGTVLVYYHDGTDSYLAVLDNTGQLIQSLELSAPALTDTPQILTNGYHSFFIFSGYVIGLRPTGLFVADFPSTCVYAAMEDDGMVLAFLKDGSVRQLGFGEEGYYIDELYMDLGSDLLWAHRAGQTLSFVTREQQECVAVMQLLGDSNIRQVAYTCEYTDDTFYYTTQIYPFPDGKRFLVFDYYPDYDQAFHGFSENTYILSVYDGETLTITQQHAFQYSAELWLTGISADGTKLIFENCVFDMTSQELAMVPLMEGADASRFQTSAFRTGELPTVTAMYLSDPGVLYWWEDGSAMQSVPVPYEGNLYLSEVTQSGYITLLQRVTDETTGEKREGYLLFSTGDQSWHRVCQPSPELSNAVFAAASQHNWFAALGTDGTLRVYDWEAQQLLHEFSTGLLAGSLVEVQFIQNDLVLLVCDGTNDKVTAVRTEDGAILGTFALDNGSDLTIQEDTARNILYLGSADGETTGLQIDMDNWTVTARIPRLVCFTGSGTVIQLAASDAEITACPVYSLEELVQMGNAVLNGDT